MKRKIYATILLLTLWTQPAYANPIVLLGVGVSAAALFGGALVVAGGNSYYKPRAADITGPMAQASKTTAAIGVTMMHAYTDFQEYAQQVLKGKLVTAKASIADLAARVAAPPAASPYPALQTALYKGVQIPAALSGGDTVPNGGSFTGYNGRVYKVNQDPVYQANFSTQHASWEVDWRSGDWYYHPIMKSWSFKDASGDWYKFDLVVYHVQDIGVPSTGYEPAQMSEALPKLTEPSTGPYAPLTAAAADDFVKLAGDEAARGSFNIVHYVDAVLPADWDKPMAPPYVAPIASPAPLNPAQPYVTGLSQPNVQARDQDLVSARERLVEKERDLTEYKQGHPSSTPENDPMLRDKEAGVAEAQKDVSTAEKGVEDAKAADKEVFNNPNSEGLKSINWKALERLKDVLSSVWPFSMIVNLRSYFDELAATPQAPRFSVPMPLGPELVLDLAPFDPVATVCRYLVSTLLLFGGTLFIVRWWRGGGD